MLSSGHNQPEDETNCDNGHLPPVFPMSGNYSWRASWKHWSSLHSQSGEQLRYFRHTLISLECLETIIGDVIFYGICMNVHNTIVNTGIECIDAFQIIRQKSITNAVFPAQTDSKHSWVGVIIIDNFSLQQILKC